MPPQGTRGEAFTMTVGRLAIAIGLKITGARDD
jgi:hypothetical protein